MNTTFIAMGVAILAAVGLLVTIAALSLLSGALNFLFVKPRITFLKSAHGKAGFAFGLTWDQSQEDVKFDQVRIVLSNPFGDPTQVDIIRKFDGSDEDFAIDLAIGSQMESIFTATQLEKASLEIEVLASKDGVAHQENYKAMDFIAKVKAANTSAEEFNKVHKKEKTKPLFSIPERTFIADPLPKSGKALKLATNPEFAGQFAGGAGEVAAAPKENFAVSKVWIEPGCIVCNACEGIFPEVFEVTSDTCLIRPGAPLNDGLRILESAEACPVEVIKFTRA